MGPGNELTSRVTTQKIFSLKGPSCHRIVEGNYVIIKNSIIYLCYIYKGHTYFSYSLVYGTTVSTCCCRTRVPDTRIADTTSSGVIPGRGTCPHLGWGGILPFGRETLSRYWTLPVHRPSTVGSGLGESGRPTGRSGR